MAVANFTIATTSQTIADLGKGGDDAETIFLRSTAWRDAAKNAAVSLTRGSRVIAAGRIKPRTYETKTGLTRTVLELEIDDIGPSLRYVTARVKPTQRSPRESRTPAPGTAR